MQKKSSALTAALSGAPPPPPQAPAAPTAPATTSKKSLLDLTAFPCIAYAQGDQPVPAGSGLQRVVEQVEDVDLNNVILVGSAPTNVLLNGAALSTSFKLGSSSFNSNFLSDAVIGSLPKGLSTEEQMKIKQSVPQSPSSALLKEMNPETVSSRTPLGKRLRRQVMKGAVMVYVTAGYSGKRFIFEKGKELGLKQIVLDGPDSWVQLLEKEGIVEKFVPIDFSDADTVFDRCLQAIRKASKEVGELDGITTFCEMAVPLASRLAEKLGLPHNPVQAVDNARDKHATREIMEKAGLPTPRHYRISTPDDLAKAAAHVGFPAVIKPISGAASIGVIRVNNNCELTAAYKRVQNDMKRARIVAGALIEGDETCEDDGNAGTWIPLVLMLEEYLDGDEVDCDLIFCDGVPVYGAITDNWPTVEPYFNETGSNCPSILPRKSQAELLELSVASVQALGFKLGVFHVECKYTSRGARLIEVNCRMGGGPVRDTNLLVWGVDLVEEHLMVSAGIPVRPPVARRPLKHIAEYTVNAQVSGVLQHADFLKEWQNHPEVLYARPLVKAGHKCVCAKDGLPTWIAELMVFKPTVEEAIAFIRSIEQGLQVPILANTAGQ